MARQKTPPVREAGLNLPLNLLEVARGDWRKTFQAGQLGLEGAAPLLPRLNSVEERLEVAALGDRSREPGELLL